MNFLKPFQANVLGEKFHKRVIFLISTHTHSTLGRGWQPFHAELLGSHSESAPHCDSPEVREQGCGGESQLTALRNVV